MRRLEGSKGTSSTSASNAGSVLAAIRGLIPSLAPAERRVAQAAVDDPSGTAASTITQLAMACSTSETTVIRFCRQLDFRGYPELRLALAAAAGHAVATGDYVSGQILPGDTIAEVIAKVSTADSQAISDTAAQLDRQSVAKVVKALRRARRIDVFGIAASGYAALDLQQKLLRIGRMAFAASDPHMARVSAALLTPRDVAVAISHSGSTHDTVQPLALAKSTGATTVAITNFPRSPIVQHADFVLTTAARETTFRSGAMASRIAQLTVVDILFVLAAQSEPEITMEALRKTYEAVRGVR